MSPHSFNLFPGERYTEIQIQTYQVSLIRSKTFFSSCHFSSPDAGSEPLFFCKGVTRIIVHWLVIGCVYNLFSMVLHKKSFFCRDTCPSRRLLNW